MARFVGNFRIHDRSRTVRGRDGREDEFIGDVHAGTDAAEAEQTDPMAESMKRFKQASERRWGNGQVIHSDMRRAYADASPEQRFTAASDRLHNRRDSASQEPGRRACDCTLTPMQRFQRASRARR